mmetsp:Transcript_5541/g.15472  ORF Transcript_5541/g.15472 Transcript_5541/m.15472 type:complete len:212 (+) Transcript_5541:595-1230(+)
MRSRLASVCTSSTALALSRISLSRCCCSASRRILASRCLWAVSAATWRSFSSFSSRRLRSASFFSRCSMISWRRCLTCSSSRTRLISKRSCISTSDISPSSPLPLCVVGSKTCTGFSKTCSALSLRMRSSRTACSLRSSSSCSSRRTSSSSLRSSRRCLRAFSTFFTAIFGATSRTAWTWLTSCWFCRSTTSPSSLRISDMELDSARSVSA